MEVSGSEVGAREAEAGTTSILSSHGITSPLHIAVRIAWMVVAKRCLEIFMVGYIINCMKYKMMTRDQLQYDYERMRCVDHLENALAL